MIRIEIGFKSGAKIRFRCTEWKARLSSGYREYSFTDMTPKAVIDLDTIEYIREV